MRFPRRFQIVRPWLRAQFKGPNPGVSVSIGEVASYLTRPGKRQRAARYVKSFERDGEYWRVSFRGLADVLYWPSCFDLDSLCEFIDEQFNARNWHQYEVEGTLVDPSDVVFDLGACEGLFALRVARRCRKVIAFEPLSQLQRAMKQTFAAFPNVEIVPMAVGQDERSIRFHCAEGASTKTSTGELEILQTSLDAFVTEHGEHIDFLKADIEGAEMAMLEGARETLIRDRPKIAITTYHLFGDSSRFSDFLRSLEVGYRFKAKGINGQGDPVMLHAWVDSR
jgi:FkbM family methyltransferase